jgi:dTDP-4-amino-4,6-dideoxygalactose transaminase
MKILRVHGQSEVHQRVVGGNCRLDALQAAVLRVKLKYLDGWIESRRRNAARYRELLEKTGLLGNIVIPADVPGHVYNQFVIRCSNRDLLKTYLSDQGIGVEIYYPLPLHLQECFSAFGNKKGDCPVAESAASDSLALPIYPELTEDQQHYVVDRIGSFFKRG